MHTDSTFTAGNSNNYSAYAYLETEVGGPELIEKIKAQTSRNLSLDNMSEGLQKIHSEDPDERILGAIIFRRFLSKTTNPPIDEFINTGVIPKLLELFKNEPDNHYLRYEIAWTILNVASGTSSHVATLISFDVPLLLV
jgi:hypothetical protein